MLVNVLYDYGTTGSTLYLLLFNSANLIWNGSSWESPLAANWATYLISGADAGVTGIYEFELPATVEDADTYSYSIRLQAGGSPAVSDTPQASGGGYFNGTDFIVQTGDSFARLGAPAGASVSADIAAIEAQTDDIGIAGAGLTALGDTRLANLDATISSRTKPADTQARVTLTDTTTTLTNAPSDSSGVTTLLTRLTALRAGYLDVLNGIVAAIWANTTRTLTSSGNAATTVSGSAVSVYRGTTWSIAFTSLGNITGYSKIWLTVKQKTTDADSQAIVQIEKTVGLTVLNGSATVTAADGSITVDNATLGNITIALKPASSSQVTPDKNLSYDVKVLVGTTVSTLVDGRNLFQVISDVTRTYA